MGPPGGSVLPGRRGHRAGIGGAAGWSGVHGLSVGEEVYGYKLLGNGTCAEVAAVPAGYVARKPASLSHVEAAALPCVALTAYQAIVDVLEVQAGETVAIAARACWASPAGTTSSSSAHSARSSSMQRMIAGSYQGGVPRRETLDAITTLVDSGRLRLPLEHIYQLSESADAQLRAVDGHVRGKLVIHWSPRCG